MTAFVAGLLVAGLAVGYLGQRIGPIKVLTIYKAPGNSVDVPIMPPTRWSLWLAWLREAARWAVTLVGLMVLAGWALGGCG